MAMQYSKLALPGVSRPAATDPAQKLAATVEPGTMQPDQGLALNLPDRFSSLLGELNSRIPEAEIVPLIDSFQEALTCHRRAHSFLNCLDALQGCPKDFLDGSRIAGFLVFEASGTLLLIAAPQRHSMIPFVDVTLPSHSEILQEFSTFFDITACKVLGGGRLTLHSHTKSLTISHPSREFGAVDLSVLIPKVKEQLAMRACDYQIEISSGYSGSGVHAPREIALPV